MQNLRTPRTSINKTHHRPFHNHADADNRTTASLTSQAHRKGPWMDLQFQHRASDRSRWRYCVLKIEEVKAEPEPTPPISSSQHQRPFPTTRRPIRLQIKRTKTMEELLPWSKERRITLGPVIPEDQLLDVLQTLWTYRGMESTGMKDQIATDLVTHRAIVKEGTPIFRSRPFKLASNKEWWLNKFAQEGFGSGMYDTPGSLRDNCGAVAHINWYPQSERRNRRDQS